MLGLAQLVAAARLGGLVVALVARRILQHGLQRLALAATRIFLLDFVEHFVRLLRRQKQPGALKRPVGGPL